MSYKQTIDLCEKSALHMFEEVCIKVIVREREKKKKANLITNPIYMLTRQQTYTI